MTNKESQANRRRVKALGLAGAAAFVTLGALSLGYGHGNGTTGTNLANSGDAPTNTVYVQPTDKAMTMGATATFTTPNSVEQSPSASPALKAGG
jgi:hypothetical protein